MNAEVAIVLGLSTYKSLHKCTLYIYLTYHILMTQYPQLLKQTVSRVSLLFQLFPPKLPHVWTSQLISFSVIVVFLFF